ncbi:hypothetical protein AVEN_152773-1 [Araneus ventricosus]|uniref:Uncharacterized protein n=1 Tax=Araneus ventricosus TaxID=182803 RepID=A0A4Y2DVT7_ARAVE|nr:hypothetical protein AVEN_3623-1 [Araneus ventricosus]GBM20143.1 hypothetical protein AVEN_9716-1 [Araneus ventricosus]GBM20181.1 hypothetical protein AVEN_81836-1 [Araneus ventricosus]GBM20189.1 hypothetical protein AVEN_152773-1 [Araneus ventricosus]
MRPAPRSSEISVTSATEKVEDIPEGSEDDSHAYDDDFSGVSDDSEPQLYSQLEINDLVRDLGLSKDSAERLVSRLKENNLLAPDTSFSWFRKIETAFIQYLTQNDLVYCSNVPGDV